ncbi:MAG: hypothetical protein IJF78_15030 [Clostridia bacterium]|nr:hypothetical protein [Clostridia bacterium]
MKKIVLDSFIYFGRLIVALLSGLLCITVIVGLIAFLLGISDSATELRAFCYLVIACGGLFLGSYRDGYKKIEMNITSSIFSGILMGVYQIIVAKLVKFNMYASGAAYYCANLYYSWKDEIVLDAYDIPDIIYIVIMLVIDVFYIMSILGGSFLGKKKRLNERQNMITNNK